MKVLILVAARLLLLPATVCQSGKSPSSGIAQGWESRRFALGVNEPNFPVTPKAKFDVGVLEG